MAYTLRHRKQNATYLDSSDPESDSHSSDPDYSRSRPGRPTKRRNTTLCTPRAIETEKVDSSVDLIARHREIETEMVDSSVDLVTRHIAIETEMVDSSVDLIARHREIGAEMVDSSVALIARRRAIEAEMVDSSVDLSARRGRGGWGRGRGRGRGGRGRGRGGRGRGWGGRRGGRRGGGSGGRGDDPGGQDGGGGDGLGGQNGGQGDGLGGPGGGCSGGPSGQVGGRGDGPGGQGGGRGTRWGRLGRRGRPSMKRAEGEQNKETSDAGPSSSMIKGSPSSKRQSRSMKRGSSSPERASSSKKTILSWLIDCKLIEEDEQVCYMDGTKESATMTGRITRGGILCSCCQRETSVWTFEKHAGSDLKQPYEHIYLLRKRTCLQDCQIAAWQDARERKRREIFAYVPKETAADQNDDACSICGDGGDLICCDKCPSTFHPYCMNMERVPHCDWLCPYCICKYCGLGGDSKQFITCSQCDKKFHWGCFKEFQKEFSKETLDLNCSRLYCGPGCREIYEKLESSLGIRTDIFASYSWRVIRQIDMVPKVFSAARNQHLENNSKVAVAWTLMNESFETITDRHTGIDVVQSVVYSRGSNLTRINFSRFYTFILEKDDEIICAASVRIHGRRVAEMPFIATEETYRGQGICRALLMVIESFLCNLKVKNLVIPSVLETTEMWKSKYGFKELSKELKRELASYNILMFPRASRLQKDLSMCRAAPGESLSLSLSLSLFLFLSCMKFSLSSLSRSPSTDGGEGNEDKQTDNQNGQARRPLPDLNVDPRQED